jgi:hypothetical protein
MFLPTGAAPPPLPSSCAAFVFYCIFPCSTPRDPTGLFSHLARVPAAVSPCADEAFSCRIAHLALPGLAWTVNVRRLVLLCPREHLQPSASGFTTVRQTRRISCFARGAPRRPIQQCTHNAQGCTQISLSGAVPVAPNAESVRLCKVRVSLGTSVDGESPQSAGQVTGGTVSSTRQEISPK